MKRRGGRAVKREVQAGSAVWRGKRVGDKKETGGSRIVVAGNSNRDASAHHSAERRHPYRRRVISTP